jgi:hypothetical protein
MGESIMHKLRELFEAGFEHGVLGFTHLKYFIPRVPAELIRIWRTHTDGHEPFVKVTGKPEQIFFVRPQPVEIDDGRMTRR